MKMRSRLLILLGLVASVAAAQFTSVAQEVLLLAPQLKDFAGSRQNFERLAAGLTSGKTIMLSSITSDGTREEIIFTPARPMPAAEAARRLESAREALLARGIASSSTRDIAAILMGGTLHTPNGAMRVAPMIAAADPAKPLVFSVHNFAGSPANYRMLMRGLTLASVVTLTDPADRRVRVSFTLPGAARSEEQARQALVAASELLASFGIYDPTLEEVRAALIGGTAETTWGKKVLLRGVLEAPEK
jgi:hypothetical protein